MNTKSTKKGTTIWTAPFIMIFAVNICNAMGFHILTPILPMYAVSLDLGNSVAGMLGTMFAITSILSRLALTRVNLAGRYRKAIILALSLIGAAMVGFSFSKSAGMLYLFRLVQGVGWGICTASLATLAALTLPADKLGAGIGMFGLGSVFGQALAPNLGITLVEKVGYRATFLISFGMLLVAIILCFCLRNIEASASGDAKNVGQKIAFKDINWSPVLPTLFIMISMIPEGAVTSFITLTAQDRGVSEIGLFFTVNAFALLVTRPFFGKMSDRISPWVLLIPSMLLFAAEMIGLSLAKSLIVFLVMAVLNAISYGSINPTTQAWSLRSVDKGQMGLAQIIFYTGLDLGSGIGTYFAGLIADKAGYANIYLWMLIPIAIELLILIGYTIWKKAKPSAPKEA